MTTMELEVKKNRHWIRDGLREMFRSRYRYYYTGPTNEHGSCIGGGGSAATKRKAQRELQDISNRWEAK